MTELLPVEWPEKCDMCGVPYELDLLYEKYKMLLCPRCLELVERRKENCPHARTVCINEEGNAGVFCADCGEQLENEC